MHVKKGDKVKVISGKDKGKSGAVVRALPKEGKVVVEGVAVAKRHVKGRFGQTGRVVERPMPIDASNVARVAN
jgi:large subunit ribosomal protein L24